MTPAQAAAQAIIDKLSKQRCMTVEEAAEVIASAYPRNDSMYDPMTAALCRIADALERLADREAPPKAVRFGEQTAFPPAPEPTTTGHNPTCDCPNCELERKFGV